jgi:hypothetical protein
MDAGHRFAALPERAPWVLAGTVLTFGWLAVWLGQDFNFDLLNYHYYVGYAFLHGRMNRDVVPGGIQTFVSPVLNAFHYLGIAHLPPRFFGFLLGALHGLNMPILFLLGVAVLSAEERRRARSIALLASLVGAIGPDAVSLVGTTFGDNLVSIPGLLALVLVVRSVDPSRRPPHPATLVGAGVLAGEAHDGDISRGSRGRPRRGDLARRVELAGHCPVPSRQSPRIRSDGRVPLLVALRAVREPVLPLCERPLSLPILPV